MLQIAKQKRLVEFQRQSLKRLKLVDALQDQAVAKKRLLEVAINIRPFSPSDYEACAKIYQDGMDTGIATFEAQVPPWEAWDAKFLKQCRLVAVAEDKVVGWSMLSPFSPRKVYEGVAEVTVYIAKNMRGMKIGSSLLKTVIAQSEAAGFWTLQAKIFPGNTPSISLFENCGFRRVGYREKIGKRMGKWHDNVVLERRSRSIY